MVALRVRPAHSRVSGRFLGFDTSTFNLIGDSGGALDFDAGAFDLIGDALVGHRQDGF